MSFAHSLSLMLAVAYIVGDALPGLVKMRQQRPKWMRHNFGRKWVYISRRMLIEAWRSSTQSEVSTQPS